MLVRITHHCTMHCSHCMIEATPDGEHMTVDVFRHTLDYVHRMQSPWIFLSGGEPTDHPDILPLLQMAKDHGLVVLLMSNGLFLEGTNRRDEILDLVHTVQVTNDPRFYPLQIHMPVHPKVGYETQIRQVAPFGRALTNKLACTRLSPFCFNLRSLTRLYHDVLYALQHQRARGAFCSPSVNLDGTVVAGEAPSCSPIGTVRDTSEVLTRNICNLTCTRCGLINNCSQDQKRAVGEARIIL